MIKLTELLIPAVFLMMGSSANAQSSFNPTTSGAVTTAAPTYTPGTNQPFSLSPDGGVRVDANSGFIIGLNPTDVTTSDFNSNSLPTYPVTGGFYQTSNSTTIGAGSSSATISIPAGTIDLLVTNTGTGVNAASCQLGAVATAANGLLIPIGATVEIPVGSATQFSCIVGPAPLFPGPATYTNLLVQFGFGQYNGSGAGAMANRATQAASYTSSISYVGSAPYGSAGITATKAVGGLVPLPVLDPLTLKGKLGWITVTSEQYISAVPVTIQAWIFNRNVGALSNTISGITNTGANTSPCTDGTQFNVAASDMQYLVANPVLTLAPPATIFTPATLAGSFTLNGVASPVTITFTNPQTGVLQVGNTIGISGVTGTAGGPLGQGMNGNYQIATIADSTHATFNTGTAVTGVIGGTAVVTADVNSSNTYYFGDLPVVNNDINYAGALYACFVSGTTVTASNPNGTPLTYTVGYEIQ
jgi:hypothetical protein